MQKLVGVLAVAVLLGCGGSSGGASDDAGVTAAAAAGHHAADASSGAADAATAPITRDAAISMADAGATFVDAATGSTGNAGAGPVDAGPQCLSAGADCLDDPSRCCDNTTCVRYGQVAICSAICTHDIECATKCCAPVTNTTVSACGKPEYCGLCIGAGADCLSDVNGCCPGSTCAVDGLGNAYCADTCTKNSACMSGCCAPLSNSSVKICSALKYCQ